MNRLFLLLFGAVTFVAHAQVPDYVPTEGLVAWYPFNGNANDESGNGNNGVNNGATLTMDRFSNENSAYYFSGSGCSTRIDAAVNTESIVEALTISAWILRSGNGCIAPRVMNFRAPGDGPGEMDIGWDNNGFGNIGSVTTTSDVVASSWNKPADNIWTQLIYVNDGSQGKFYQDGVLFNTVTSTGNPILSGNAAFGRMNHPSFDAFNGKLDDIGIWNRALTEDEITALYNAELPVLGCTDPTSCNFNVQANEDDGSCVYPPSESVDCEFGGNYCGEGTIWDASLQACVGFDDCLSDLDGDGIVGVNDLLSLLSDFGTECPPEVAEWTCGDPVSYHGYDYATVQIGEQCWFAENLRTEMYQNGDSIETASNIEDWVAGTNGKQVIYGNNIWECQNLGLAPFDVCDSDSSLNYFGRLYNWYAVDDEHSLCPAGWHVPSDSAFSILETFLGMPEEELFISGWRGTNQGEQLKSSAADNYAWNGSNATGFSAVPAGTINSGFDTPSGGAGYDTVFWTSNYHTSSYAWYRTLNNTYHMVHRYVFYKHLGASVRCLKD